MPERDQSQRPTAPDDSILPTGAPVGGSAPIPSAASDERYQIEGVLGEGGMGTVYKARHLGLKRTVALKVIRPDALTADMRARFQTEAEAVAQLDHPHIIKIHDCGDNLALPNLPLSPYLALEYVAGGSLARALKDGKLQGPNGVRESAHLVAVLARAMQHAHDNGIVHRDLKPDNVLCAASSDVAALNTVVGVPKITDFGLARQLSAEQRLTQSGAFMGTPQYMAPEQTEGKRDVGPAADVWALGVILYECLTGRLPFRAESMPKLLYAICMARPKGVREIRAEVPEELERICLECLAKDPKKRPGAKELSSKLARYLRGSVSGGSKTRSVAPPPVPASHVLTRSEVTQKPSEPARERKKEKSRDRDWSVTAGVTLAALVVVGGLVLLLGLGGGSARRDDGKTQFKEKTPPPIAREEKGDEAGAGKGNANGENKQEKEAEVPIAGEKEITNSIGMRLAMIPAGSFRMGADDADAFDDEKPVHNVTITQAFRMGIHEVTQKQFQEVMGYNPGYFSKSGQGKAGIKYADSWKPAGGKDKVPDNTDDFPVENVSHEEAEEFCRRLSDLAGEKKAGRTYRLPTEAEWEYACRAVTSRNAKHTKYHFGDAINPTQANFSDSNLGRTTKVGSYGANAFGLYDVHGNVWEWCLDSKRTYKDEDIKDQHGGKLASRVLRGGSWGNGARSCRAACRFDNDPGNRNNIFGFRVVVAPSTPRRLGQIQPEARAGPSTDRPGEPRVESRSSSRSIPLRSLPKTQPPRAGW